MGVHQVHDQRGERPLLLQGVRERPERQAIYGDPFLKDKYGEWLENQGKAIGRAVSCGKIATMSEFYGGDFWVIAGQTMNGIISADEGAKRMKKEMSGIRERAGYKQK